MTDGISSGVMSAGIAVASSDIFTIPCGGDARDIIDSSSGLHGATQPARATDGARAEA